MKHTAESLAAMTDAGINMTLAELLGTLKSHKGAGDFYVIGDVLYFRSFDGDYVPLHPNYCRSYDAIMPLVFEHRISLISLSDGYMASKNKTIYMDEPYRSIKFCTPYDDEFVDTNPLRAAACCLILVLQETKGD